MAEATEMTLTGVRSARVGEETYEVRLSVTYALDKDEERMERVCAVKMAEVEHAIIAAWNALQRNGLGQQDNMETERTAPEPAPADPDEEEYDGYFNGGECSDEEPDEEEPVSTGPSIPSQSAPSSPGPSSPSPSYPMGTGRAGDPAPGNPPGPHSIPAYKAAEAAGYQPPVSAAPARTEPEVLASRVQLLAIRPLLTKLNFTSDDTRDLLQKVFKKWSLERLTRDEANDLLVSLRRGDIEAQEKRQGAPGSGMNGSYSNGRRVH